MKHNLIDVVTKESTHLVGHLKMLIMLIAKGVTARGRLLHEG